MPLHQSLTYIKKKIEEMLNTPNVDVYLDSIGKDDVKEGVYVSLLYAEEEKTLKNNDYLQTYYEKENPSKVEGYRKVNPKLYLNLYVLIVSSYTPYEEALKHISRIVAGIRTKNVYGKYRDGGVLHDDFDSDYDKLEKLVFDIHTLTFEQNNSLWQTIGSKLCPYVIYKVKMAAFAETKTVPDMVPIKRVLGLVEPIGDGSDIATADTKPKEDNAPQGKNENRSIFVNSRKVYEETKAKLRKEE